LLLLLQSYENWVDDTPELESDFPSEEEMTEFEYAEKVHKEQFAKLEHRASQFSQTLGVFGRLSNKKLGPALNGFVREGVRFGFSNLDSSGEDSLVLGSRLSFLLLLSKYASWAKKDRKHKAEIQEYVDGLEMEMRDHEEYDEVHVDDLESLATFRDIVALKHLPPPKSGASVMSARSGASVVSARSGRSVASAVSGRSSASAMSARSGRSPASTANARSGASVMSTRSSRSVASAMSARSVASAVSARSGTSVMSGRSGVSVASARSGASVASGLSASDVDVDESLDSVSVLPSPVPSTGGRSAGSRASRTSHLSSTLPTLPESSAEKEESPQDEGYESETHFSASPGDNSGISSGISSGNRSGNRSGNKRSQSQMTYEHSDDDNSDVSSVSEVSRPTKSRRNT